VECTTAPPQFETPERYLGTYHLKKPSQFTNLSILILKAIRENSDISVN
jgi:hypothetical protein